MDAKELKEKIDLVVTDYNTKTNNDTEYAIVKVMNEINDLIEENGAFYKVYGAEKPLIYDLFYLNSILKWNKTKKQKISLINTYFNEEIYKVSMNQNIFNFLPKIKTINIEKAKIKSYNSSDKSFRDLVSDFCSKDDLRPNMQMTNFNSLGIVSTDAHKLLFISKKDDNQKEENKCISDFCLKNQEKHPLSYQNTKYPNWKAVIPQKHVNPFEFIVDTDSFRGYLEICLNFGFFVKNYNDLVVSFKLKDSNSSEYAQITFDLIKLIDCLEALLKLGINKTKIHFGQQNRAIIFTDAENNEIDFLNQSFILLMPVINNDVIFYFDFESNSVVYADKKYEYPIAIEDSIKEQTIQIKEEELTKEEFKEKNNPASKKEETPAESKVDNDVFDVTKLDLNNSISSRVYYRGVDNEINKISKNDYKPKYDFDKKGVEWVYKNTRYNVKDEDLILELKEALAEKNRGAVDIMRINNELPRIESKYGKDVNLAKRMYQEAKDFYENKLRTEKSIRANDVFIDYLISRLKETKKEETPIESKSETNFISPISKTYELELDYKVGQWFKEDIVGGTADCYITSIDFQVNEINGLPIVHPDSYRIEYMENGSKQQSHFSFLKKLKKEKNKIKIQVPFSIGGGIFFENSQYDKEIKLLNGKVNTFQVMYYGTRNDWFNYFVELHEKTYSIDSKDAYSSIDNYISRVSKDGFVEKKLEKFKEPTSGKLKIKLDYKIGQKIKVPVMGGFEDSEITSIKIDIDAENSTIRKTSYNSTISYKNVYGGREDNSEIYADFEKNEYANKIENEITVEVKALYLESYITLNRYMGGSKLRVNNVRGYELRIDKNGIKIGYIDNGTDFEIFTSINDFREKTSSNNIDENKPKKEETPAETKSDLEYLKELLATSNDLLDLISDTGSKADIDFLKSKIEATENLISLLDGDEVVKKKTILLAPNGKPSNLTPEQYKLVRTPKFKAWFGDFENDPANASKVVDSNGEPMVCYHATDNKFWEFKKEKQIVGYYGKGFYFSNSLEKAKQYGKRVIPAFLNIKSIFELSDETPQKLLNELAEANVDVVDMGEENNIEQRSKYTFGYASENSDIFMNNLIKKGYYGIRMIYDLESTTYFFVAFEPNQIKLADGTNTTFDGKNPDIRFEDGGEANAISDIIIELKNKYLNEYGIESCDINKGECYNFSEELLGILLKNGYNDAQILTTELFRDMADEFQKQDDDEIFYNPLDYGGKRPINFIEKFYAHSWVFVNGKHYDSDAPYGVENFYDLIVVLEYGGSVSEKEKQEWKKFVLDNSSWFNDESEENDDNEILLTTRRNGNTSYEEVGQMDLDEANDIAKKVKSKFPKTEYNIETVGEYVDLYLRPTKTDKELEQEKAIKKIKDEQNKSAKLITEKLNIPSEKALEIIKSFSYPKEYYEKNKNNNADKYNNSFRVYFSKGSPTNIDFDNAEQVFDYITKDDFIKSIYNRSNPRNEVLVGLYGWDSLTIKFDKQGRPILPNGKTDWSKEGYVLQIFPFIETNIENEKDFINKVKKVISDFIASYKIYVLNDYKSKKETPTESKSDLEFLNKMLETSKDLLDLISDTGSKTDIDFLKSKIEATENLISLLQ